MDTANRWTSAPLPIDTFFEIWFNNSQLAVAVLDSKYNFVRVNKAYAQADKCDPGDFPGKNHFDLYPNPAGKAIFDEVLRTLQPYQAFARPFEYQHSPERGLTHWDWTLSPILNASGEVDLLVLTLVEATARIKAEEVLAQDRKKAALDLQMFSSLFRMGPVLTSIRSDRKSVV